jgi:hypothetical protein
MNCLSADLVINLCAVLESHCITILESPINVDFKNLLITNLINLHFWKTFKSN